MAGHRDSRARLARAMCREPRHRHRNRRPRAARGSHGRPHPRTASPRLRSRVPAGARGRRAPRHALPSCTPSEPSTASCPRAEPPDDLDPGAASRDTWRRGVPTVAGPCEDVNLARQGPRSGTAGHTAEPSSPACACAGRPVCVADPVRFRSVTRADQEDARRRADPFSPPRILPRRRRDTRTPGGLAPRSRAVQSAENAAASSAR
jgi:hypothetical protein